MSGSDGAVVRLARGVVVPGNRWDLARDEVVAARSGPFPPIAVIVTHFRQEAQLQLVYAALAAQRIDCADLEVIVVDDGSPQLPPPPPPPLRGRVLRQPDVGIRPAAARNLGARSTAAEILVFLDGDTVPEPDYLATMAAWPAVVPDALVVGRRGHADLGALGPEAAQRFVASGGTEGSEAWLPPPAWLEAGYRENGDLLRVDRRSYRFVISAVVACHRQLFDDVGGFDASIRRYGSEDWEVAYRVHNNGGVLVHEPDAVAWHDGPRWEDRSGDLRARNDEAMRLAARIPAPGSRAPGVLHGRPDVIVELALGPDLEVATAVATVASILVAQPDVHVHLDDDQDPAVGDFFAHDPRVRTGVPSPGDLLRCRARVVVHHPMLWGRAGMAEALDVATRPDVDALTVIDDGEVLAEVRSTWAVGRIRRAGAGALDGQLGPVALGAAEVAATRLGDEVDLAAVFARLAGV